jgi:hypothetical protein
VSSSRSQRVIAYAASLLAAPLPLIPYERAEHAFVFALIATGVILASGSLYVAYGEWRLEHRSLLGNKLLVSGIITLIFALCIIGGSLLYLARNS